MKISIKSKLIVLCLIILCLWGCSQQHQTREIIYVGTFNSSGSEGIYVFEFDRNDLSFTPVQIVSDRSGPNFQILHPNGKFLYSVSSDAYADESNYGTVSAYRIERETGKLSLINEQSVKGRGPCHVSIDPLGELAYISNYGSGNLSVFRIKDDGGLSEAVDLVQHEGSSLHEQRQTRAYMHSIIPSADGKFIYASDLGIDKILIYEIDRVSGKLSPAHIPYINNTPGSGPRHFTIHPNGNFAYSAEELSSTVAAFSVNKTTGALEQIQRLSMLPNDFDEINSAADIHISPDGKYLYASNRGHNSLVIYSINLNTGLLTLVGHEPTQGGHPRNFSIDPKGEFVMVANRDNDNVVLFKRNLETGKLTYTGIEANVPAAVCVTHLL